MLAYRLLQAQTQPEFQEVPEPHAGPGQVVGHSLAVPAAESSLSPSGSGYDNHGTPRQHSSAHGIETVNMLRGRG
jgi:hypothetical protein